MAMIFPDFYTTPQEIREAFDAARAKGKSHLLILNTACNDYYAVRDGLSFHGVDKPEDIIDILREKNEGCVPDNKVSLIKTYDTSQDFDHQNTFSNAAGPLAPAYYFIDPELAKRIQMHITYLDENIEYNQRRYEYDNRPVLKKIFDHVLMVENAPIPPTYPQTIGGKSLRM